MPSPSFCLMVPILKKAPPNEPSHNASKLPCAKWRAYYLGQLISLVPVLAQRGLHMPGQMAPHPTAK